MVTVGAATTIDLDEDLDFVNAAVDLCEGAMLWHSPSIPSAGTPGSRTPNSNTVTHGATTTMDLDVI